MVYCERSLNQSLCGPGERKRRDFCARHDLWKAESEAVP
jgi:hypothetical protein